jgi:hypothetical protein
MEDMEGRSLRTICSLQFADSLVAWSRLVRICYWIDYRWPFLKAGCRGSDCASKPRTLKHFYRISQRILGPCGILWS